MHKYDIKSYYYSMNQKVVVLALVITLFLLPVLAEAGCTGIPSKQCKNLLAYECVSYQGCDYSDNSCTGTLECDQQISPSTCAGLDCSWNDPFINDCNDPNGGIVCNIENGQICITKDSTALVDCVVNSA